MSSITESPSKGLVARFVQKVDGEQGVARLNRRAVPVKEEPTPEKAQGPKATLLAIPQLRAVPVKEEPTPEKALAQATNKAVSEVDDAILPVSKRVQQLDGDEGVARLNRRAVPESTPEKAAVVEPTDDMSDSDNILPVAMRVQQLDGDEGVARLNRRVLPVKEEVPEETEETDDTNVSRLLFKEETVAVQQSEDNVNHLLFTPREGPAAVVARPALRNSIVNETARRNSRVSFAKDFGLDMASEESEVDMGLEDSDGDEAGNNPADTNMSFATGDNSDSGSDDDDLDEEYDFDHEKLAELVKSGADRMQLASVVEDAMASALERKLARKAGKEPRDIEALAAAAAAEGKTNEDGSWDLEGHMTPTGQMTPPASAAASPALDADAVAERAKEAIALANARRRRSSAARKQIPGIALAMEQAKERRRQSLAKKFNGGADAQDKIQAAMEQARGRHRASMCKAADVLECADYDLDGAQSSDVAQKMRLVQQAMEDARVRHRRSISTAMQQLQQSPEKPNMNIDAQEFTPVKEFIPQQTYCATPENWNPGMSSMPDGAQWSTSNWTGPSTAIQNRIAQAVTGAYETHCYQQGYSQEGYMQQDYMQNDGSCQQAYQQDYSAQNGSCQQTYQQNSNYGQQQDFQQQGYGQEQVYQQQSTPQYAQDSYQQGYVQQVAAPQQYAQQQCQQAPVCEQQYYNAQEAQSWQCQQPQQQPDQAWQQQQYGMQAGDASWNCNGMTKDTGCWDNQQTYSQNWRLGSA